LPVYLLVKLFCTANIFKLYTSNLTPRNVRLSTWSGVADAMIQHSSTMVGRPVMYEGLQREVQLHYIHSSHVHSLCRSWELSWPPHYDDRTSSKTKDTTKSPLLDLHRALQRSTQHRKPYRRVFSGRSSGNWYMEHPNPAYSRPTTTASWERRCHENLKNG